MSLKSWKIALATCSTLPEFECDDDFLHAALKKRGIDHTPVVWNDPKANWSSFDACLVRTTWDYTQHLEDFRNWLRSTAVKIRLFNPLVLIEANLDKRYLRALEAAGIPTVPTHWLESGTRHELAVILKEKGWRSAFLKPAVGVGSQQTLPFNDNAESIETAQQHLDEHQGDGIFLLQPFLKSVQTKGELSLIYFDHEFSHAVQKVPVAGDYRVQDDFGAKDFPVTPPAAALELAESLLKVLPARALYARVDLLFASDGRPMLNEFEQIEPSLFFRHRPQAATDFVNALISRLESE
ncbi:MAG: hypothetical protein V3W41_12485 [Planctomycetota bacterium]